MCQNGCASSVASSLTEPLPQVLKEHVPATWTVPAAKQACNERLSAGDAQRLYRLNQLRASFERRRKGAPATRAATDAPPDGLKRSLTAQAHDDLSAPRTTPEPPQEEHDCEGDQQANEAATAAGGEASGEAAAMPPMSPPPEAAPGEPSAQVGAAAGVGVGAPHAMLSAGGARPPPSRSSAAGGVAPSRSLSASAIGAQLARERFRAARRNDLRSLNRLRTPAGIAAFYKQQRMRAYATAQRLHNRVGAHGGGGSADDAQVQVREFETQTDEMSEWSKTMLERDEQSLEHLAEADLAYLEMVRTKAGLHHQTAGALATSEAEQALADSWQKLIMLRLKSQKLQLRQQANPMSRTDMERVESELMSETTRIASKLQEELQQLTTSAVAANAASGTSAAPSVSASAAAHADAAPASGAAKAPSAAGVASAPADGSGVPPWGGWAEWAPPGTRGRSSRSGGRPSVPSTAMRLNHHAGSATTRVSRGGSAAHGRSGASSRAGLGAMGAVGVGPACNGPRGYAMAGMGGAPLPRGVRDVRREDLLQAVSSARRAIASANAGGAQEGRRSRSAPKARTTSTATSSGAAAAGPPLPPPPSASAEGAAAPSSAHVGASGAVSNGGSVGPPSVAGGCGSGCGSGGSGNGISAGSPAVQSATANGQAVSGAAGHSSGAGVGAARGSGASGSHRGGGPNGGRPRTATARSFGGATAASLSARTVNAVRNACKSSAGGGVMGPAATGGALRSASAGSVTGRGRPTKVGAAGGTSAQVAHVGKPTKPHKAECRGGAEGGVAEGAMAAPPSASSAGDASRQHQWSECASAAEAAELAELLADYDAAPGMLSSGSSPDRLAGGGEHAQAEGVGEEEPGLPPSPDGPLDAAALHELAILEASDAAHVSDPDDG